MPPFHFPFFYNSNYYSRYRKPNSYKSTNDASQESIQKNPAAYPLTDSSHNKTTDNHSNNRNSATIDADYFFELFGLKLYFDDILLMCLLFFLYNEGVRDDELFISLILLLLT